MSPSLSALEQELLTWVLPKGRPLYGPYRECVARWAVASRGERSEGHLVLAPPGAAVDLETALPQVFAYGVFQTSQGDIAVTVRERVGQQLDCDISNLSGGSLPTRYQEIRRWSYSEWGPGMPCPICADQVREVHMRTEDRMAGVLAVCSTDRRMWVFDSSRAIALPVPLTSFYAELMRVQGIRDPERALDPHRFYSTLHSYTDRHLTEAFVQYNKLKPKISLGDIRLPAPSRKMSILSVVRNLMGTSSS